MENLSNKLVAPCPEQGVGVPRLSLGSRVQRGHSWALDPPWQWSTGINTNIKITHSAYTFKVLPALYVRLGGVWGIQTTKWI